MAEVAAGTSWVAHHTQEDSDTVEDSLYSVNFSFIPP
jgi:hypothetical protein